MLLPLHWLLAFGGLLYLLAYKPPIRHKPPPERGILSRTGHMDAYMPVKYGSCIVSALAAENSEQQTSQKRYLVS